MPKASSIEHARCALQGDRQVFWDDSEDSPTWQFGWYLIDKLSQDERVVRFPRGTIIRGLDVSGRDSQSETGALLSSAKNPDLVDYFLCETIRVIIGSASGNVI